METVQVERDTARPGCMIVTLHRPEKLNAISWQMHLDLQQLCRDLLDDHETRVVIFTGEGRAFSAGAELTSAAPGKAQSHLDRRLRLAAGGERTSSMIERLDQVTIGAVNGLAIGGAVVLLSCMDMRIAAESAWFSIPEVELNMPLTWNALPRLMRELGPARTRELVMACERFTAQEAERWGFVNHVYPDAELHDRALALADRLLSMDPMALAMTKAACNALAQLMVPEQPTYADRDQMLLLRQLQRSDREPPST